MSEQETIDNYVSRLVDGALRYASYDRSDPFAIDRCMCHIRQGLCKSLDDGHDGHYDALIVSEIDKDGNVSVSHRNLVRP